MKTKRTMIAMMSTLLLLGSLSFAQAKTTIRLATLAPANSSWVKIFQKAKAEIEKKTNGEVEFKIYAGGVQGDENIVISKLRSGSLQSAAITGVGLSKLAPEVLVLQAPGLITDYKTLDRVRKKMKKNFEAAIEKEGFIVLGWADVGVVNVYSTNQIRTPSDLADQKVWVWSSDPITRQVAKVAGISGVSKGVPDVLPALNTGQINALMASPLACLSLQWYGKMKYRIDMPMGVTVGAIVVSKEVMDSMSPEHRQIVIDVNKKWSKRLIKKVRKSNKVALKILTKKGIQPVKLTPDEEKQWKQMGAKAQNKLKGKVYSAKALNEARKHARWKAP